LFKIIKQRTPFLIIGLLTSCFLASCTSKVKKICIGDKTLKVEVAKTFAEREKGLMDRKVLKEGTGMIFIFEKPGIRAFWMKNTLIPLSVAYFDKEKKLINIHKMRPAPKEQPFPVTYESKSPALYAVEANWGWFEKNNITKGAKLDFCR